MVEPVAFISHFRIKEGKAAALRTMFRDAARALEAEKPRTLVFLSFLDETASRVTILHVFADADAMDAHFVGAEQRAGRAYEVLSPEGWDFYGKPSDAVVRAMRQTADEAGVPLSFYPEFVTGFLRATSARPG
jgi:quinol monooxygenase YgiN